MRMVVVPKEEMNEKGCHPSTHTYTVLTKAICDVGSTDKAFGLLDEMIGYVEKVGLGREANGMFRKMLDDGLVLGTTTYNALINGYCKEGKVVSAFELLGVMERRNCKPNIHTFNELIERASQLAMAFRVFNSMNSIGLVPDGFTYTTLIDGLCKEGRPEEAEGILGLMVKKGIFSDEVTFTALIDGYCKTGKSANPLMVFERMVKNRCLTTPHAFNSCLDALSKVIKVNEQNTMFGKMLKYGLIPSVVTYTILIDELCRAVLQFQEPLVTYKLGTDSSIKFMFMAQLWELAKD
ncbi:unnamed protein product [Ilex paraguariensis]|uniref:Pentatricopeptide repeat-containing protein n=1 Tax=Ilex paraguariensis TaxID=185542 RepID=A0ABC8SK48_9AQUA